MSRNNHTPARTYLADAAHMRTWLGVMMLGLIMCALFAGPGHAQERITKRADFLAAIGGRQLVTTGVRLRVVPDGTITGRAFGQAITGSWQWRSGWFCRALKWGRREWPLNCQQVQRQGQRIIFTADKGRGDTATLRLR